MLTTLLITNWPGVRVRMMRRMAKGDHRLAGVVIRPPKEPSRFIEKALTRLPAGGAIAGRMSDPLFAEGVALRRTARACGAKVIECRDINAPDMLELFRTPAPDVILTLGWPQIFGAELLSIPRLGCINCHPSLLPRHRGGEPAAAALLEGDAETGVSYHCMTADLDAGDILLQRKVDIAPRDDSVTLMGKCGLLAVDMVNDLLEGLEAGTLAPIAQDPALATDTPRFNRETDGLIDWSRPAAEIDRKVRAHNFRFPIFTYHHGQQIEFTSCEPDQSAQESTPGEVVEVSSSAILVGTGDGCLRIRAPSVSGASRKASRTYLQKQVKAGDHLIRGKKEEE